MNNFGLPDTSIPSTVGADRQGWAGDRGVPSLHVLEGLVVLQKNPG